MIGGNIMKLKKIILIILAVLIVAGVGFAIIKSGDNKNKDNNKLQVVASNFASYDFLRAIIGENENVEITFLIGPGKDAHSYDPTAGDLITIQNADLFVYVGGEMEKWSDKVLNSLETNNTKIICIADFVKTIEEQKEMEQKKRMKKRMKKEVLMNIFGLHLKMQ